MAMSSVIDNYDKNKQLTVVSFILYGKEYVKTYEVKDIKTFLIRAVTD